MSNHSGARTGFATRGGTDRDHLRMMQIAARAPKIEEPASAESLRLARQFNALCREMIERFGVDRFWSWRNDDSIDELTWPERLAAAQGELERLRAADEVS